MKIYKIAAAVVLSIVLVLVLASCSFEIGGESSENWEITTDNREDSMKAYNDFFEKTFNDSNMTISVSASGSELFTENISGDSSYAVYSNGARNYAFIKDSVKYFASEGTDNGNIYMIGDENYESGYKVYKSYITIFQDMIEDDSSVTFKCVNKGERTTAKDGAETSKETLAFEISRPGYGTIKINAESENGLVRKLTMERNEKDESSTMSMSFTYGSVTVNVPDLSNGWINADNGAE